MKTLLHTIILMLLVYNANAQYTLITNFSGTSTYGGTSVTVTSAGAVTTWTDPCVGLPLQYWAGSGSIGSYTFTFSRPVYKIHVISDYTNGGALGAGEYLKVFVNGAFYPLTAANMSSYITCAGGGPSYLWTGFLMGPTPSLGNYNGGIFEIISCAGINSIELYCDGSMGNGTTWDIGFNDTFQCTHIVNNNPCFNDTIKLDMTGDSTGATYLWKGPGGFVSVLQDTFIYPATFADTGWYYVYKTVAGVIDTDSTHITVYPKPTTILTDNAPLCAGLIDTLQLNVNLFSTGETFIWTGPNLFTSTLQDPTIPGFSALNVGTYTVVATTTYGCKDTGTVSATTVPPPGPPIITGIPAYCFGQPFVPFSVTGYTGTLQWYTTATGGTASLAPPVINTSVAGYTTVFVSQLIGSCESPRDSFQVLVRPQIIPALTWKTTLGCASDQVTFTNLSNADWYSWDFGDGSSSTDTFTTSHTFTEHKIQTVRLRAYIPGCELDTVGLVNTNHVVKALFTPLPDILCADSSTVFQDNSFATEPAAPGGLPNLANLTGFAGVTNVGIDTITNLVSYSWNFGDGSTDNLQSPVAHIYNTGGKYHVTLSVTDSIGCVADTSADVYVLQYHIQITHDTMLCISQPLPLNNTVTPVLIIPGVGGPGDFTYHWSPADNLDDTSAKVPYYTGLGITTYTFTATENQYGCSVTDTERINSVKGVLLANVTSTSTISYGSSIQLNADSEVIYEWKPNDGSLSNPNINNPIATPTTTTLYTVYGYDANGCLDSTSVNIIVDSTMTEDIPSGFTPNGDGLNDVFRPVGLKFQNMVEFRVYNRWGQQLFYSNNYKVGWDGTYNGVPQDIGVYYYVMIVARPGGDGANITYKGEVTLIR